MTITRQEAYAKYQRESRLFSRDVVGVPLYPYQTHWADYVVAMAAEGRNETVVVKMPRQSGKNETSAQIEAMLLSRMAGRGGQMVKCAPTWKPQIIASMLRLEQRTGQMQINRPGLKLVFRKRYGYMVTCGKAALSFLSAAPTANVVSHTASLLMEVDEAQDVDSAKFQKDFSPMRASTGAPIVAYGTSWTDDTLLMEFEKDIREGRTSGRVFRVLPDEVADANPAYGDFVDSEVRRKGRQHPLVKTQYFLEELESGGRALSPQTLHLMAGGHAPRQRRSNESQVVAGLDFAGSDENAGDIAALLAGSSRDSVALTIGELHWTVIADGVYEPVVRILTRYEWVNVHPASLHGALYRILWQEWRVDRCHCDETGIGETNTRLLQQAINRPGRERVVGVKADGAWNADTRMAGRYMAMVLGARLMDYQSATAEPIRDAGQELPDDSDPDCHAWWQRGHARIEAKAGQRFRLAVPESEGHDDLLKSELLLVDAAYDAGQPRVMKSGTVKIYG
ncbi:MAG: hypothetical protein WBO46_15015 [Caldilineaceae bacterium]